MNTKKIIFIVSLLFTQNSYADQTIKLCIDGDCKTSVKIVIDDDKWSAISDIFIGPAKTAYTERKYISKALALIEKTSLAILAEKTVKNYSAEELHNRMDNKDQTLNYKAYISLLLDQKLIRHHFLRKTEQRSSWTGMDEYSIVIQNHAGGKLYALDADKTDFGKEPVITHFKSWKKEKTVKNLAGKAFNFADKNITGNSATQFKNHAK